MVNCLRRRRIDDGDHCDIGDHRPMEKERIRGHRDLEVWQRAVELTAHAYRLAAKLPASERPALVSQIRRCAASVPANIAEGSGRLYPKEFVRHISVARGSLMELDTHLEVAVRTRMLTDSDCTPARALIDRVGPMLTNLAKAIAHRC